MKHALLLLLVLPIAACASAGVGDSAPAATPATEATSQSAGSATGAIPATATAAISSNAAAQGAATTPERFQAGHALFAARCQRCHALPAPTRLSPDAWPAEVAGMARKSGLNQNQVALISDYLVAASRSGRATN